MRNRKIVVAVMLLSIIWVGIQSCCKAYCYKSQLTFKFVNFAIADIDTLVIAKYEQNGQFNNKIDSFYNYQYFGYSDTVLVYIDVADQRKDYKIKIPALGTEYNVTDIQLESFHCNCNQGTGKRIKAYKVNGIQRNEEMIELKK